MGFFDGLLSMLNLNKDEYDDDGMGYDDYQDFGYVQGNTAVAPMAMNDSSYDDYDERPKKKKEAKKNSHKVTPIRNNSSTAYSTQVRVIKPTKMESCKDIADILLSGTVVLINYGGMNADLSQRISDFVSGAVYSINGKFERISNSILIAVPAGVGLDGDLHDVLSGSVEIPSFRNN